MIRPATVVVLAAAPVLNRDPNSSKYATDRGFMTPGCVEAKWLVMRKKLQTSVNVAAADYTPAY
jgi:hypothetical protein